MVILDAMLKADNKTLGDGVKEKLGKIIRADKAILGTSFGNAGYLKNLLGELKKEYFARNGTDNTYTLADLTNAFPDKKRILSEGTDSAAILKG